MVIYHIDRAGHGWRFNVPDCTKAQAGAFARVLRQISRIGVHRRGPQPLRRTPTEKANAEFCENMERAILETLAERFPATPEDYAKNEYFAL